MSHHTPAIILISTTSLIATILVLNIQFLFPPPPTNPSVSQGMKELWSLDLCDYPKPLSEYMSYISSIIPVPDVNSDGINDIVAGAWDNNTYCLSGADGSILWKHNLGRGMRNVWAVPSQEEDSFNIVASTANNDGNHNGETYLLTGKDGSKIWECSKGSAILLIPDINDDGVSEVVIEDKGQEYVSEYGITYVSEYESVSLISGANGEELWNSLVGSYCNQIWGSRCTDPIENLGSDIIACWYDPPHDINRPYLFSFDLTSGEKIWSCQVFRPVSIVVAPVIGETDVIVGAVNGSYLVSSENGEIVWTMYLGTETVLEIDVTQDINGDGVNDILAGSVSTVDLGPSEVRLLNGANGTTVWEYSFESYFRGLNAIQDLNKDGVFDVVVVSQREGEDYVYILNGVDGEVLAKYVLPNLDFIQDLVVIPDVNGDGFQDIIVTAQSYDEDQYYRIFLLAPDPSEFQEQESG